jgi:hypothetical protein
MPVSAIGGGWLLLRCCLDCLQTGGVERVGSYFAFIALGGDFFSIQNETDAGGVAGSHHDLMRGADRGVRGRNQVFVGDGFAIGR